MATVYIIWSRAEKKQVPYEGATYPTSQAASDAARRLQTKQGDAKDIQGRQYDAVAVTV